MPVSGSLLVTSRMVGRQYGSLVVLRTAGSAGYPSGQRQPLVLVRCDCGSEYTTPAHTLRQGVSQCRTCAERRNAVRSRRKMSVPLPNGWTIAQVALAHGLPLGTVYRRWVRGWPVEQLGEPLRKGGGGRGLGGHVDLPERRRTMLGGA